MSEPSYQAAIDALGQALGLAAPITGIIDFGAALVSHPAWDFASIAFYHGWPTINCVLAGYQCPTSSKITRQTELVALVLALYKFAKAQEKNAPTAKWMRIGRFIQQLLLF